MAVDASKGCMFDAALEADEPKGEPVPSNATERPVVARTPKSLESFEDSEKSFDVGVLVGGSKLRKQRNI